MNGLKDSWNSSSDLWPEITLEDQIDEAIREYRMRQQVYSVAVSQKRMNSRLANRRIAVMAKIIKTLEQVHAAERRVHAEGTPLPAVDA